MYTFIHVYMYTYLPHTGVQSNCVAIVPKETELGRKRAVDTAVCNSDLSCNKGFCPSFITIAGRRRPSTAAASSSSASSSTSTPSSSLSSQSPKTDMESLLADFQVPQPSIPSAAGDVWASILVCGIGGTGVVTMGAVLSRAAAAAGLHVNVFDQVALRKVLWCSCARLMGRRGGGN